MAIRIVRSGQQGAVRVTRKSPHGDSRTSAVESKGSSTSESAYTVLNGSFRVLFPLAKTTTSKRILNRAVSNAVAKVKD